MNLKESEAIIEILCEFFEVAVHNILYIRKLYPEEIFEKRKKYGVMVYQSMHPQLNEYINESLNAVRFHAKSNQLKQLHICIANEKGTILERFIFNVFSLKNSFDDDPIYVKLERNMRDFCLKLHTSPAYLQSVPETASFRIMLHTTEVSSMCLADDPLHDNFPWLYVSENEYKIAAPDILPVHTIDTNCLGLEAFIERSSDVYSD